MKSPCNFCGKEIPTDPPKSTISEIARGKGFCNWFCKEQSNPTPDEVLNKTINRWNQEEDKPSLIVRCYCALCKKNHSYPMKQQEYKAMLSIGNMLTESGELKMACDECHPS